MHKLSDRVLKFQEDRMQLVIRWKTFINSIMSLFINISLQHPLPGYAKEAPIYACFSIVDGNDFCNGVYSFKSLLCNVWLGTLIEMQTYV